MLASQVNKMASVSFSGNSLSSNVYLYAMAEEIFDGLREVQGLGRAGA